MEVQRHWFNLINPSERLPLVATFLVMATAATFASWLCAIGSYRDAAAITALSIVGIGILTVPIRIETLLLVWFVTTPLFSFYLRYPLNRSIITYDRLVLALLVLLAFGRLGPRVSSESYSDENGNRQGFSLTGFEIAWTFLSILALASCVALSNNFAFAIRVAVDAFCLPIVAFYIARKYFSLDSGGRALLLCCAVLAIFLFATGIFEFATGIDVFRYKGSEIIREGERRVNGPFASDSSFAIICLLLFLFLQASRRLVRDRFDQTGRLIYLTATLCAGLGALLSVFRVVVAALVICWLGQRWLENRSSRRTIWSALSLRRTLPLMGSIGLIVILAGGWIAVSAGPALFSRLTDPKSGFGRLATWQAAAEIAISNPVFGVGLTNYADYFDQSHYYSDEPPEEVQEAKAVDSPHSNLLWIASELGLGGFVLYITANFLLLMIGWRGLKVALTRRNRVAASVFAAMIVAYWITGVTLASGNYSDLNLCFFFLLGVLSGEFGISQTSRFVSES